MSNRIKSMIIPHLNKKVGGVVLTVLVSIILLVVVILPVSFSLFKEAKEVAGSVDIFGDSYCLENGFNKLSDCMLIMENKSSTVVDAKSKITAKGTPDFSKISITDDGLYSTVDDNGNSYYYRGNVKDNYVSYAGYIWRIIRENGDGSVRMIYSGTKTSDVGEATSVDTYQFNSKYRDPTHVGYKYHENFALNTTENPIATFYFFEDANYQFGEGYTFDESTKKFKLTGNTISGTWENVHTQAISSYPYTCFSTDCDVVQKVIDYQSFNAAIVQFISYSSRDYNSTLFNTTDSTIKTKLEAWYEKNILYKKDVTGKSYSSYISDEVFCNDRSVTGGTGYLLSPSTIYAPYNRIDVQKAPTLKCKQMQDRFSVSAVKGNSLLKYPIGLIIIDEVSMAGGLRFAENTQYYLYTGQNYWTLSPCIYDSMYACADEWGVTSTGNLDGYYVGMGNGVRPVINLSSDVLVSGGNGTAENPYTVKLA